MKTTEHAVISKK